MKTYHYIVQGRVQGVFFRYNTEMTAHSLSVRGTVRNLPDGNVEIYAQGEPDALKKFEDFLHAGPPAARVQRVVKEVVDREEEFSGFEIIY